jgi:Fe2+ transport system protein FeoA
MHTPENDEHLVSLSRLSLGQKALIVAFSFDTAEGECVEKLGLTPGEQVEIVRLASGTGLIEIKIRGYFASLKTQEADHIKVRLIAQP